jgi:hypothetical protein
MAWWNRTEEELELMKAPLTKESGFMPWNQDANITYNINRAAAEKQPSGPLQDPSSRESSTPFFGTGGFVNGVRTLGDEYERAVFGTRGFGKSMEELPGEMSNYFFGNRPTRGPLGASIDDNLRTDIRIPSREAAANYARAAADNTPTRPYSYYARSDDGLDGHHIGSIMDPDFRWTDEGRRYY